MPLPGKRKRAIPKQKLKDYIKTDLRETGLSEVGALNRLKWKKRSRCGDPK